MQKSSFNTKHLYPSTSCTLLQIAHPPELIFLKLRNAVLGRIGFLTLQVILEIKKGTQEIANASNATRTAPTSLRSSSMTTHCNRSLSTLDSHS
ncbi:hypothetical protein PsorP6_011411 [Peronosclerospora sorghi]|uniref:Uncharacterized protein n=1 Tax=Peronosclerospora sorghi TaxID=230839 RepID=A0ACC0WI61_9STRA|nr:hypothetical protein PsorP6_011411 [Peronosclerospora sorghi]